MGKNTVVSIYLFDFHAVNIVSRVQVPDVATTKH